MSAKKAIILNNKDNVGNALSDLKKGDTVEINTREKEFKILLNEDIPYGFKFSLEKINKGDYIRKYGEVIGRAVEDINTGYQVHVHNVEGLRGRGDLKEGGE